MAVNPAGPAISRTRATTRHWLVGRVGLSAAAGLLTLSVLAACGSSATATKAPAAGGASASTRMPSMPMSASGPAGSSMPGMAATTTSGPMIHISGFSYSVPASVRGGATVSVMNMDGESHTVTADTGNAFDVTATAGSIVTFKAPAKPGRYPFHCSYHAEMHGVLVVT